MMVVRCMGYRASVPSASHSLLFLFFFFSLPQNFHYQDGWLSEFSARGYEVATETLFLGTQV